MGVYDTLIDGNNSFQIKCLEHCSLREFSVGELLPLEETEFYPLKDIAIYDIHSHQVAVIENKKLIKILPAPEYDDKWLVIDKHGSMVSREVLKRK